MGVFDDAGGDDSYHDPTDNCLLYKIAWPSQDATADMLKVTLVTLYCTT